MRPLPRLRALLQLAVFLLPLAANANGNSIEDWRELLALVRREFPTVRQLGVAALRADREGTLLVDVREPEEFAVSRIPGAVNAQDVADVKALLARANYSRVVVYCSVGYRSSRLASQLARAGVSNVVNLEGSIFAWANAGLPLENARGPVSLVHPDDAHWGRFLRPALRAPIP